MGNEVGSAEANRFHSSSITTSLNVNRKGSQHGHMPACMYWTGNKYCFTGESSCPLRPETDYLFPISFPPNVGDVKRRVEPMCVLQEQF